jgi:hypothetical protein
MMSFNLSDRVVMKWFKLLGIGLILASSVMSESVLARGRGGHIGGWHGGSRFGVFIGPGFGYYGNYWPYWGWGYPYYYPPVVTVPTEPPVYIEQGDSQARQQSYWFYCPDTQAYYPYVRECPGGWERVPAQPPQH